MKKILVPVYHEGLDDETLSIAKDFVENMGAQLHIVTVLFHHERLTRSAHVLGGDESLLKLECGEIIAHAVAQLADVGVSGVTMDILKGDPASEIIDCADREKSDLILIHSHGMGVVKRFTIGSVTNTIVHHASVPVLVVK